MASSGSVFSDTLQEITSIKLNELSKRHSDFEEAKSSLLASLQIEQDPIKRLVTLSDGVKSCFDIKINQAGKVLAGKTKHPQVESELSNLDRFLDQARCDPSVSTRMVEAWERSLHKHFDAQSLKFRYASLYGKLVTEWLSGGNNKDKKEEKAEGGDVEMGEAFEIIGNAAKLEAKADWEKMAYHPSIVDEAALLKYLDHLFGAGNDGKKDIRTALAQLRRCVRAFELELSQPDQFNYASLQWVIQGLLSSDQLTNEKRETLRDFQGNEVILNEIADVLNMRLAALSSWSWNGKTSVPVEMRRKINGVYDVRMSEHLLQSLFVQYIGVRWSVFFKSEFTDFRNAEGAWKPMCKEIPREDKLRLGYYLGPLERGPCLELLRRGAYNKKYFLTHLTEDVHTKLEREDGEEEAAFEKSDMMPRKKMAYKAERESVPSTGQRSGKRHRKVPGPAYYGDEDDEGYEAEMTDEDRKDVLNPIRLKQNLLHMLSTEIILNTRLYGEMTAFHSVFDNWDAALPHGTILAIFQFFGVSKQWLSFFKSFLQAPLRFEDDENHNDDDEGKSTRPRLGGTPSSFVLSDVFTETSLFCLDFAVNQATEGEPLWRIREDIWFWSRDHAKAVKAWDAVDEFASVTGTNINTQKTGTVRISRNSASEEQLPIDETLPQGEIRWGFLRLSPRTGRFEIDQSMVDAQIEELRRQLSGNKQQHSRSVLGFVQAWNTFAGTFFNTNFGKPANCFGRQHVDEMLATHQRIQREIFASFHDDGTVLSSVAEHLKKELHDRFGVTDVPDGYLYFPIELGGLGLQSSTVSLLQIRDEALESSTPILDNLESEERKTWERARTAFLTGQTSRERYSLDDPDWKPESQQDQENFMSFDEYIRYRECFFFGNSTGYAGHQTGAEPHNVYKQLMRRPTEKSVVLQEGGVSVALEQLLKSGRVGGGITGDWGSMEPYWRWMAMIYGPEVVERFGDLNIVEAGLLPMGMVSLFREKRVKW